MRLGRCGFACLHSARSNLVHGDQVLVDALAHLEVRVDAIVVLVQTTADGKPPHDVEDELAAECR